MGALSSLLPGALAHTETKVTATAAGGDQLFCMDIKSAPGADELVVAPALMPAVEAGASHLKLAWTDCGDSSTHTKITGFTPSSITTGQKATMTGTGDLDEDVSGANFDLEMKTLAGKVSCKGDASQSKTCSLPLGVGSLTFNAMAFPIKKGTTSVSVDLSLSALLPGALAHTETKVTATATGGDELFCMDIKSAPAVDEVDELAALATTATQAHVEGGTLAVTYKDCGDASTHAKITGLSPSVMTIGEKTTITGTGSVDEDISDGAFTMSTALSAGVPLMDCTGDASIRKKCSFPFASGAITFDGVKFPIKAGTQEINVDLYLSPILFPVGGLLKTTTRIETVSKGGDKIFCIKVITGKDGEANGIPLSFQDCGDAQTHVKITGLTPSSVGIGRKVRITGTGTLDKDITDGTYHMQTFYSGGDLLDCNGDAGHSKKCSLMGGLLGSMTFNGLSFPVKKGTTSVSVDLSLNSHIPAALAQTETKVVATKKNGDQVFCIEVFTAPATHTTIVV